MHGEQASVGPLGKMAQLVQRRRGVVILLALVVGVVASFIGLPPRIDANIISLLPDDQPQAVALRRAAAQTGGINTITLTFQAAPGASDGPAMRAVLDQLAEDLQALDDVAIAVHRLEEDLALYVAGMRLPVADVEALAEQLEADPSAPAGSALSVLAPLQEVRAADLTGSSDGRRRIVVKPTASNVDPDFCARVVAAVSATVAAADLPEHGIEHVYSAGTYVYIADGAEGVRADLARTAGVTALLVIGVLVVGFRTWRAPLIVFPPLLLAAVVNLAVIGTVLGSLNTFTSFGTALLIGLGIDFAVHLISRTREERAAGHAVDVAVVRAWDRTGRPCLLAALTSSAGFAALAIGDFKGLAHLGFSLAMGLMLCLVAMLVLLPILIPLLDTDPRPLPGTRRLLQGGGGSRRSARVGLGVAAVLTAIVAATGLTRLEFEHDITRMNRDKMAFSDLDSDTKSLVREGYPPVVVFTPDLATTYAEHRRLEGLVASGALPHIRGVRSIASLLPGDRDRRDAALRRLQRISRSGGDLSPSLQEALAPLQAWRGDPGGLSPQLLQLFGGENRVLLIPTGDLFDMRQSAALIDEVGAVVEGAGSEQLAQGAVFRVMQRDTPRMVALAVLLVALLTAADLRRPALVAGVVASLVLGMVWGVSAVAAVGQRVTLMNLVGFPVLLGIGVDVVIHLAHRLRTEGSARGALGTVGMASLLSTLTTIASFVSLTAAGSGGIRSLGRLVSVGLSVGVLASGTLLLLGWAALAGERSGAEP